MRDSKEPDILSLLQALADDLSELRKQVAGLVRAQVDGWHVIESYVDDARQQQMDLAQKIAEANDAVLKYVRGISERLDEAIRSLSALSSGPKSGRGKPN